MGRTTYYVSSSEGNNSNAGTSVNQPWKTLAKVNGFKPVPGDQILFKRGDEWEGTLTVPASGNPIYPITYSAYGTGDKPKIYGSKVISGWKHHSGNIYEAVVDREITQLFADGKRMKAARYPKSGFLFPTATNGHNQFFCGQLDGDIDYTGATCIFKSYRYRFWSQQVLSSKGGTINLQNEVRGGISVKKGFILVDKLEFLTQGGEWYFDSSAHTLYFWPLNNKSPNNQGVRGSVHEFGVYIESKKYIILENLAIMQTANTGYRQKRSSHITVSNCDFIEQDLYSAYIGGGENSHLTFVNNFISGSSSDGIMNHSSGTVISENIIENIGLFEQIGGRCPATNTGIRSTGDFCTISNNVIRNIGYNGIMFSGLNTMIENNVLDSTNTVLDDGAAIYTQSKNYSLPGSAESVIRNNIITNVFGTKDGTSSNYDYAFGIYLDDNIRKVKVENNTIAYCTGGIYLHNCGLNEVTNNVVFDAIMHMLVGDEKDRSVISNNIFYATARKGNFIWWNNMPQRLIKNNGNASPTYENNTYIHRYEEALVFNSRANFAEWQKASGQDNNSTFNIFRIQEGETERLFYNASEQKKVIQLGNSTYRDFRGNFFSEKLLLEPFTSKILIKSK